MRNSENLIFRSIRQTTSSLYSVENCRAILQLHATGFLGLFATSSLYSSDNLPDNSLSHSFLQTTLSRSLFSRQLALTLFFRRLAALIDPFSCLFEVECHGTAGQCVNTCANGV